MEASLVGWSELILARGETAVVIFRWQDVGGPSWGELFFGLVHFCYIWAFITHVTYLIPKK